MKHDGVAPFRRQVTAQPDGLFHQPTRNRGTPRQLLEVTYPLLEIGSQGTQLG